MGAHASTRGVTHTVKAEVEPSQSAALFVGISEFGHATEVPYAVDDAVDLAYLFALDPRVGLVPPSRVILALSGTPQKDDSKMRLEQLKRANPDIVRSAEPTDIVNLLEEQAALTGSNGLLVVSLATHGFHYDGIPHILGASSRFEYRETSLPLPRLFDIAAKAKRSLIFVDACRESIDPPRTATPDPAAAAPLLEKMERHSGQVTFYAAAAGEYAHDDPVRRNGVFTLAVLDGLRCGATVTRNVVTVEKLQAHIEAQVLDWVRKHKDSSAESVTQVVIDGRMDRMPLAMCPPPPIRIDRVAIDGNRITAFAREQRLWTRSAARPVTSTFVEDLDADGRDEVVAATREELLVFDLQGADVWRAAEGLSLHRITTGKLLKRATHQVVTVWKDEQSATSRIVTYDAAGERLASYEHAAPLDFLQIYSPNGHFKPRIVAAGGVDVLVFHGKKLKVLWQHAAESPLTGLGVSYFDGDKRLDLTLETENGRVYLRHDGDVLK